MVMPWLMPDPDLDSPNGILECRSCMDTVGESTRAGMHCGWMPREEWAASDEGVPKVGPDKYEADVCPGGLVRQPAVQDGVKAWRAWDKGQLAAYDPHGLAVVWDCVEICDRAMNLFQAERQRRLQAKLQARG